MGTSFDRIYTALSNTFECNELLEHIRCIINGINVVDYEFRLEAKEARVFPVFHVRTEYKSPSHYPKLNKIFHKNDDVSISHDLLFPVGDTERIVEKYFGSKVPGAVPTYNCSKKVVLEGRDGTGSNPRQQSFHRWLVDKNYEDNKEIFHDAIVRVSNSISTLPNTSEFKCREKEALEGFARQEISGILHKYSCLGQDVLNSALKAFLIENILDR